MPERDYRIKLGIFGGSFDPVHNGHLALADSCLKSVSLDQVWFIPTAVQPLKPSGPSASNADRLAMLRLTTQNREDFIVSTLETDRGGTSYMVDTLTTIQQLEPNAELYLLMGSDSLQSFPDWHEPAKVLELASPVVVHRAEELAPDFRVIAPYVEKDRLEEFAKHVVKMPPMPISSSEIRKRISEGETVEELVPTNVASYLVENQLYNN